MASHANLIDALNAIAISAGGTGGHKYIIDALNDWSVAQSGTGGHRYSIDALNEIAVLYGASGGHKFDHLALNAIAVVLGADNTPAPTGEHYYYLNALNEIADLDVSGGGGEYTAHAVHFAGAGNYLSTSSLSAGTSRVGGISFWLKVAAAEDQIAAFPSVYFAEINQLITQYGVSDISTTPHVGMELAAAGGGTHVGVGEENITLEVWFHNLLAWDTDHASGQKKFNLFINGVDTECPITDDGAAFTPGLNALDFYLGDDTFDDGLVMDVADFRMFVGQDFFEGGTTIPSSIVECFISGGKPVNPSVATAYFETPGVILFTGDAAEFVANQGTGGAFTLTGALTNSTTSPSD